MAQHTPNYGFNYFGPGVDGAVTDEGGKFTLGDRLLLDKILKALEQHDHKGGDKLEDPSGPPALGLATSGGQLPGGLNVYYRVSYVDLYGLETAATGEAVIATASPLAAPQFPILTAEALDPASPGLGLGEGVYSYALTAFSAGLQTPLGLQAQLTLNGTLPAVLVTFPSPQEGQDQWGVWRKGPSDVGWTQVAVVNAAETSITDDGEVQPNLYALDPSQAPPTTNLTGGTNVVTIDAPDPALLGLSPSTVKRWRIYRTFTSGNYATSSLLADVNQTVNQDGTGGLVTSYVDDGTEQLQSGQPLDVSQTLMPSVRIIGGGGGALLLTDSANVAWRVVADADGTLVTRVSQGMTDPAAGQTVLLSPTAKRPWVLSVDATGTLVTTQTPASPQDTVYLPGSGPLLPSTDPTVAYQLTVDDDGSLVTTLI